MKKTSRQEERVLLCLTENSLALNKSSFSGTSGPHCLEHLSFKDSGIISDYNKETKKLQISSRKRGHSLNEGEVCMTVICVIIQVVIQYMFMLVLKNRNENVTTSLIDSTFDSALKTALATLVRVMSFAWCYICQRQLVFHQHFSMQGYTSLLRKIIRNLQTRSFSHLISRASQQCLCCEVLF